MNTRYDLSTFELAGGRGDSVAVLAVREALNYTNYDELIERTRSLYESGHDRLILDLSGTPSLGTAGFFALLSSAVLYNGQTPADPGGGLRALSQMADAVAAASSPNLKVFNPPATVAEALRRTGVSVYESLDAAIASFDDWPLQRAMATDKAQTTV